MKPHYDCIFVLLVYVNTEDLKDYIKSLEKFSFSRKIIIVNSYHDDDSMNRARTIALDYDCDFINVKNRGYGAGNNSGIKHAQENYNFDYLIVSNPDMEVAKFDYDYLQSIGHGAVIGPKIITSTGKNQNPFYVDKKRFPRAEYKFMKERNMFGYYSIIAINKIVKLLFFTKRNLLSQHESKVYAVHGSFIIFHAEALSKLGTVFDENMFLFCEEMALAEEMRIKQIPAFYTDLIEIYHKEDGSMRFLDGSMYDEEVKSNGYVVQKYFSGDGQPS